VTLAIEKPAQDLSTRDVKVLPDCPPWCIGNPDWHDPEYAVVHASEHHGEQMPTSGIAWDALGGVDDDFAAHGWAYLAMDRRQGATVQIGLGGAPRSASLSAVATLDEAEQFAQHLLALVALGRKGGEKR
jgi:hypothetical protein